MIKGMEIEKDRQQNLKLAPILRKIVQMGFPVKDNLISYYSISEKLYVFVGKEPLAEDVTIPSDDFDAN